MRWVDVMCAIVTQKARKKTHADITRFIIKPASDKTWFSFLAEIAQYEVSEHTYFTCLHYHDKREVPFLQHEQYGIAHHITRLFIFIISFLFHWLLLFEKQKWCLRKSLLFFERERCFLVQWRCRCHTVVLKQFVLVFISL